MKLNPGAFDVRDPVEMGLPAPAMPGSVRRLRIGVAAITLFLLLLLIDASRSWDRSGDTPVADRPEAPAIPALVPGSATALSRHAQECGPGGGGPVSTPRPIGDVGMWVVPDDYPGRALMLGQQGVTAVALHVDGAGRVGGCEVRQGSGFATLDAAACAALTRRGRFEPARDGSGCPIPAIVPQRVRWQIPDL